jgi:hypothetical protein
MSKEAWCEPGRSEKAVSKEVVNNTAVHNCTYSNVRMVVTLFGD